MKNQAKKLTDDDQLPPAASTGSCFHLSGPAELWESDTQAAEDSGKQPATHSRLKVKPDERFRLKL